MFLCITGIREACRIGREVLDLAGRAVRVGITCDELDRIVHEATVERGAYPSPLNYYKFPKSVCTSVNEVICHGNVQIVVVVVVVVIVVAVIVVALVVADHDWYWQVSRTTGSYRMETS